MKEKKNIDRIFQEKFKDFEKEPSPRNWEQISARLDAGTPPVAKKPVIPLWLKFSAAAAILALVATGIWIMNLSTTEVSEPGFVNESVETGAEKDENVDQESTSEERIANKDKINEKEQSEAAVKKDQENKNNSEQASSSNAAIANQKSNTKSEDKKDLNASGRNESQTNRKSKEDSRYAHQENADHKNSEENDLNNKYPTSATTSARNEAIASTDDAEKRNVIESIFENYWNKRNPVLSDELLGTALLQDTSLNQLEELLAGKTSEENSEVEDDENQKNLRLSTFAAPVLYANLGDGNELSNQFSNNSTSAEVTFSYGVKLAYDIAKNVKIRTGISKVNMSQNIANVSYSPTAMNPGFGNINSTEDNIEIRVESPDDSGLPNFGDNSDGSNGSIISPTVFTPGEINQQFGFIEVPLEVEYALVDERFGLNLIGGASGLFLDQNSVDLVTAESRTKLGTASNINKTSFSTNVGIGVDYEISDKISLSVEPMMKYQVNTFNNVDNVRPVNFGVYSGISYTF
ncbi:outer membrane protein [Christiangramia sp. LLG6405-1]|uniref:outer membrane protein n=1 Tax=Christiangramia sp. LLG6405-1 TaxID=3160832 RepID=UPI003867E2D0